MAVQRTLHPFISEQFPQKFLQRGAQWHLENKVSIGSATTNSTKGHISGIVHADRSHVVTISWKNSGWLPECRCDDFVLTGLCDHIAALLFKGLADDILPPRFISSDTPDLRPSRPAKKSPPPKPKPPRPALWEQQVQQLASWDVFGSSHPREAKPHAASKDNAQLLYILTPGYSGSQLPCLDVAMRKKKSDGSWETPKKTHITYNQVFDLPEEDRNLLTTIAGVGLGWMGGDTRLPDEFKLQAPALAHLLPRLSRTSRLYWSPTSSLNGFTSLNRVIWVEEPFDTQSRLVPLEDGRLQFQILIGQNGNLCDLHDAGATLCGHLVIMGGFLGLLRNPQHSSFLESYRRVSTPICLQRHEVWDFLRHLLPKHNLPDIHLPAELEIEQLRSSPRVRVELHKETSYGANRDRLVAKMSFLYGDKCAFEGGSSQPFSLLPDSKQVVHRDPAAEAAALQQLYDDGFKRAYSSTLGAYGPTVPAPRAMPAILAMVGRGWEVDAHDIGRYRTAQKFDVEVSSGIDWFDLRGGARFDDLDVPLPRLLEAIRKGHHTISLNDGSIGIIPEQWIKQLALIAGSATVEGNGARFSRNQAAILDLLLQQLPEARWDQGFDLIRKQIERFEGIRPADAPTEFVGELRLYQREGLAWFHFLESFNWGGCLADDMGLGKTVQVLALLLHRQQLKNTQHSDAPRPSLVVAPRSLIFNWMEEARRFSPSLNLLDCTGVDRDMSTTAFRSSDLVLTTYGTLRSDIASLAKVDFDYAILDESQAIKNATTATAKAVRLIRSRQRLALSGTPIENRLRELWSLFEFLNPGMLGTATAFKALSDGRDTSADAAAALGKALRPFILRRTKGQVAKELPARTELTIHCEMDKDQLKDYQNLKDHYRQSLLGKVEAEGIEKSQMQVLEALLRLRQAACHPGLIDPARAHESSAKLDAIIEQVKEVLDQGHKALVFSQFTSFLAIVRKRLDDMGATYEYLDGQTRDRQQRVMRFQNDPDCKLFLISLKAGGVGLNLTAAEYVFLLDPWWNPAVENQAIDRAHRIGQDKQVFAYRLITKDTVEEKVLELQSRKRELADAIINASAGPLASLTKEDLQLLLG